MIIDIREEFEAPASPEVVWEIISNPYEVVSCLPGAAIAGQKEDGTYEGTIAVKFGPTSITFKTLVTLELNAAAHEGRFTSQAKDSRGGTRTKATATFSVKPAPVEPGSSVSMQGSVEVSGPLANLVESGATFVIKRMVAVFAQRLAEKCAPREQEAPRPKIGLWRRVFRLVCAKVKGWAWH